jgi:Arc/MetJ family transcription regulator
MARTNIELDEDLVREVMSRLNVRTKREAVHLALQRVVRPLPTPDELRSLRGIGWDGDLAAMRSDVVDES